MADEAKKSGSPIRLLLGLFGIILLAGVTMLAYLQYSQKHSESTEAGHEAPHEDVTKTPPGTTVAPKAEPFTVNLADADPAYVYRVDIKLNIRYPEDAQKEAAVAAEVELRKAQICDIINDILAQKHYAEIMSKGPDAYRFDVLRKVNSVLTRGEIHDIYAIDPIAIPAR